MTSKSLLRHPLCKSTLAEMAEGTRFQRMYPDSYANLVAPEKVQRFIICTGQVYYALHRTREANQLNDIAIARVEQISPFPFDLVAEYADKYPNAKIIWAQEEPMNMGAWTYVEPRIITALKHSKTHAGQLPTFAGRDPTGSVATGNKKQHQKEEIDLLAHALLGEYRKPKKVSFLSVLMLFIVTNVVVDGIRSSRLELKE